MKYLTLLMALLFLWTSSLQAQKIRDSVRVQTMIQQKLNAGMKPVPIQGGIAFAQQNKIDLLTSDGSEIEIPYSGGINRMVYRKGLAVAEEYAVNLPVDHMDLRIFSAKDDIEIYQETVEAQPYMAFNEDIIFTQARTYAEWDGYFELLYLNNKERIIPEFSKGKNFQATPIDEERILVLVGMKKKVQTEKFGPMWESTGVKVYEYNVHTRQEKLISTLEDVYIKHPGVGAVDFVKKEDDTVGFLLFTSSNESFYIYHYYEFSGDSVKKVDGFEGLLFDFFTDGDESYAIFKNDAKDKKGYLRKCHKGKNYVMGSFSKYEDDLRRINSVANRGAEILLTIGNETTRIDYNRGHSPHMLRIHKDDGSIHYVGKSVLLGNQPFNLN